MRKFVLSLLAILILSTACVAQSSIVVGKGAKSLETQAAGELRKYLYAATGTLLPITTSAKGDAIAVGTPASNPLVRKFMPNAAKLGDEGYMLRTVKDGGHKVLIVTGKTPNGVLYGAYSLLEEYGYGFYLGGDAVPAKKGFKLLDLNVSRKPVFKIRGTLPWYNFFDSPTAWDYQDYVWFFDNLAKTKNNFIGFHSYDTEPFCAYEDGGKYTYGEPVVSTENPTWGTHSMKTSEFGFGTGKYFPDEYFGSKPSLYRNDRERSIKDSQDLLRRGLEYAHYRGIKTCVGFEVTAYDPTDPVAVQNLDKRLRHLIAQYPMLDYVWIWESEALGLRGQEPPALDSRFGAYYRKYEPTFAYLKDPRRITEAVRLVVYTNEASRILKEIAPGKRLILSGWGGDNHLHCTDFYPGMDKILPKDVIFSALDNIVISDKVSWAYGKLSPTREKWPIPWFEYDGDQWHNQANAERWLHACQDSLAKGSQGILGIHWRTRDVEESHAIMSQFAWNPKMTYEQFYAGYAKKTFGPEHASEMAKILIDLQALGCRWVGGSGQMECGGFQWGSPADPEKVKKLEGIRTQVQAVLGDLRTKPGYEHQAEYAKYLYDTIDWTLRYEQPAQALLPDGEVTRLLLKARAEKAAGKADEAAKTASEGLKTLSDCDFGAALDACARRVTDKGSMGMLATVNTKAYWAYREVAKELAQLAGTSYPAEPDRGSSDCALSLVSPNTIWFTDQHLPVNMMAFGKPRKLLAEWGTTGNTQQKRAMASDRDRGGFIGFSVPQKTLKGKGIEYQFSLSGDGSTAIWPGTGVVQPVLLVPPVPTSKPVAPPKPVKPTASHITVTPGQGCAFILQWKGQNARYEISRSETGGTFHSLFTVTGTWYEDRDVKPSTLYRYLVTPIGSAGRGRTIASEIVLSPGKGSMPAPTVTATAKRGKVWLQWSKAPLGVSGYRIYSAPSASGPWARVPAPAQVPSNSFDAHLQVVHAESGKALYYRVVPVDRSGNEGTQSQPVACTALPAEELKPVLAEDFPAETDHLAMPGRTWGGQPLLQSVNGAPVAYFQRGEYLAYEHRPEFNPDVELSLTMWVKLESAGAMPVMLGHGLWSLDGYFLQTYNGNVRFNLEDVGTLDAGHIEPGKWYHIAATYDGIAMKLYLNGREVGSQQASGKPKPSSRTLWIGRYEYPDDEYATDCRIAAVRIYNVGLTDREVATEYARLADKLK